VELYCGPVRETCYYITNNLVEKGANTNLEVQRRGKQLWGSYVIIIILSLGSMFYIALWYLQTRLAQHKDKTGKPLSLPRKLVLQFDNATDQKNKELFTFCAMLCTNRVDGTGSVVPAPFDVVDVNFLIPGHTHCSVDQKFSVIAKKIMSCTGIMTPVALLNVIKEAFTGSDNTGEIIFLDVVLDWETYLTPLRNKDIHFYGVSII
jgi:hypothetical protein